ncbi:hypothetical protein LTR92_011123 [Exophiala xenobiotica]|nr:hypothetical protein LTR92_011123 [Exophiala xenobiotica]
MFPPLNHAMMAVAALSLAAQDGNSRLDALHYYQQALPALQSTLKGPRDLSSDGAFLTHFLLLVYEIAAAEDVQSSLLFCGLHLCGAMFSAEKDTPFLFGGSATLIWKRYSMAPAPVNFIPDPSSHLYPLGLDGSSVLYAEELESLPTTLQLGYEVTILAVRLVLLAREFRNDATFAIADFMQREQAMQILHRRTFGIQESLRELWLHPAVSMIGQNLQNLPERPKQLYEHAATLYRACIILSHTSMWPGQRLETSPDYDTEIAVASNQILQMTRKAHSENRWHCRYLVFPVFMAGFASTDGAQRMLASDLIRAIEQTSIGRNTTVTRKALTAVYESQNERFMNTGQSLDVDWMQAMAERNMLVVNFGV